MLKVRLLNRAKNLNGNSGKNVLRMNPEPLYTPVLQNTSRAVTPQKGRVAPGSVLNQNQLRAVCTTQTNHPFTNSTFQRRSRFVSLPETESQSETESETKAEDAALALFQAALQAGF